MSLDDIPSGSRILLDANVLIYARRGVSVQSRRLLERCASGEVVGIVTTFVLAEYCHRRMMQEAQSRGLAAANPAKALAENPPSVRQLSQYAQEVEDLLAGELETLETVASDFTEALALQRQHGLLTNDSLLVATALRAGVNRLATADPQFDGVTGLTVFKPDDVM
ncbi:MAG: type II toxin-antitoxin system VapC family toxin [Verrucomicrobiales bacterium]|nr:type II toxin-antitoxin system VapC family toxin [Verrucomicrobiales bacterium]